MYFFEEKYVIILTTLIKINESIKEEKMSCKTNCECCKNYSYDEDYNYYVCLVDLDQDEMVKFISNSFYNCPYFQFNDEYKIVRKQM